MSDFQYQIWQNLNTTPARFIRIEKKEGIGEEFDYEVTAYYQNNIPVTSWGFSGYYAKVIVDNYTMNLFASGWSLLARKEDED